MLSRNFVMGGDSTLTVSLQADTHLTYNIVGAVFKSDPTTREARKSDDIDSLVKAKQFDAFFVKMMTGSNNETDYSYVGMLD